MNETPNAISCMLQCVAEKSFVAATWRCAKCCKVLQSITECCRVLSCVAVCCRVLQSVAECCRVLQQSVAECCRMYCSVYCRVCCSVLQSVLQSVLHNVLHTVCCRVLQSSVRCYRRDLGGPHSIMELQGALRGVVERGAECCKVLQSAT